MIRPGEDATAPALLALQEAARRAARGGAPRSLLLLQLGAIAAPQPHHARVARAILTDVAERLEGEVLRLPRGDLALLCRRGRGVAERIGPHATGPQGLPAVLGRLFGAAALADRPLFTVWGLPEQAEQVQAQLASSACAAAPPSLAAPPPVTRMLLQAVMPGPNTALRRQTGVRLRRVHGVPTIEPCFQDVGFGIDAPEPRIGAGSAAMDPFLFRHLYASLDALLLAALTRKLESDGSTQEVTAAQGAHIALHLNLTPSGVLLPGFDRLVALCRARATRLGVVVSFADAVAAPDAYAEARARLRDAGALLVLGGVSAAALPLTRPGAIGADLIALYWLPTLPLLAESVTGAVVDAIAEIGPARLVLRGADSEAAIGWGCDAGIALFQGRQIDAMLAAGRMTACTHDGVCALRECIDRVVSQDAPGRAVPRLPNAAWYPVRGAAHV